MSTKKNPTNIVIDFFLFIRVATSTVTMGEILLFKRHHSKGPLLPVTGLAGKISLFNKNCFKQALLLLEKRIHDFCNANKLASLKYAPARNDE